MPAPTFTYVLPLRAAESLTGGDMTTYLRWVAERAELIVVDGSADDVFETHARSWGMFARHVRPAADLATPMGKVGGVLTGVRLASNERIVIADDDVRYDDQTLQYVAFALDEHDVVRPQNYFSPLPWHACWDTGRTLLNRMTGGDWPGTLGVRRSVIERTGGYDGTAMFENLELVRTVIACGGTERVLLDALVLRRPSSTRHFFSQRVRQAYDEIARPQRLLAQLAVLPLALLLVLMNAWTALAVVPLVVLIVAECGRRRAGGTRVFPFAATLCAPLWVAERAFCSWLALGARLFLGGVPYRGRILRHAATPLRELRARHGRAVAVMPQDEAAPRRSA